MSAWAEIVATPPRSGKRHRLRAGVDRLLDPAAPEYAEASRL